MWACCQDCLVCSLCHKHRLACTHWHQHWWPCSRRLKDKYCLRLTRRLLNDLGNGMLGIVSSRLSNAHFIYKNCPLFYSIRSQWRGKWAAELIFTYTHLRSWASYQVMMNKILNLGLFGARNREQHLHNPIAAAISVLHTYTCRGMNVFWATNPCCKAGTELCGCWKVTLNPAKPHGRTFKHTPTGKR